MATGQDLHCLSWIFWGSWSLAWHPWTPTTPRTWKSVDEGALSWSRGSYRTRVTSLHGHTMDLAQCLGRLAAHPMLRTHWGTDFFFSAVSHCLLHEWVMTFKWAPPPPGSESPRRVSAYGHHLLAAGDTPQPPALHDCMALIVGPSSGPFHWIRDDMVVSHRESGPWNPIVNVEIRRKP